MSRHEVPESALASADREVIIPPGHERGEVMTGFQRAFYRFLWFVAQVVARGYFRLTIRGLEHVPDSGPYVVAPVHRSNLDTPLVSLISRRRFRYMGKESLWKSSFGAWFLTAAGGFPVERGQADRAALRASIEVIERGEPLVMFPEGTRQEGREVVDLYDGPAYVASRTRVPIVPVGIGGSGRAMPKGRKVPPPVKIAMVVGPPIEPPSAPDGRDRVPRRVVRELTEQLRDTLQELYDEAQDLAGDPNT